MTKIMGRPAHCIQLFFCYIYNEKTHILTVFATGVSSFASEMAVNLTIFYISLVEMGSFDDGRQNWSLNKSKSSFLSGWYFLLDRPQTLSVQNPTH